MNGTQLHLTHRAAYLRGVEQGKSDAQEDRDYRPRDGATGTVPERKAYQMGYMDGYAE